MKTLYKILFLIIILVSINGYIYSQSATQNYILSRTYTTADGSRYLDQVQYFDGLGRPVQTVQRGITPSTADLVSLEYDAFGRESNRC